MSGIATKIRLGSAFMSRLSVLFVVTHTHIIYIYKIFKESKSKKKVKYPRYRPTWPRGAQEVKAPTFHDTRHMKLVRKVIGTGRLYPHEHPGTHF